MLLTDWLARFYNRRGIRRSPSSQLRRLRRRRVRRHQLYGIEYVQVLEDRTLLSGVDDLDTLTPMPGELAQISSGAFGSVAADGAVEDGSLVSSPGAALSPDLNSSFEGINFDEEASVDGGFYSIPPDPHGAVGTNHVVSVVNNAIEWHTKAGVQQNSQSLNSFFSAVSPVGRPFDPKAVYDHFSDRFLVVALARDDITETSQILLAVSDDGDPNGSWTQTVISGNVNIGGTNTWADYPGFAIDEEAIYITNNQFTFGSGAFLGSRLWIVNKAQLYSGTSPTVTLHDPSTAGGLPGQSFTYQPALMYEAGPGSTGTFLVSTSWVGGSTEFASVVRVDNPLTSPSFTNAFVSLGDLQNAFPTFPNSPQPGSSTPIWTNDDRALDAVWRDGSLYFVNTILPNSGPDAGQETAHWAQVNTSTFSLVQQGNIGGEDIAAGTRTFFPSIAVNSSDNIAIGFSAAGPNLFAGAYYTIHEAGDASGTVQDSKALAVGQDTYVRTFGGPRNRWGDYTGTVLDPVDDSFWTFNQYALTAGTEFGGEDGRWGTRWGNFQPGGPTPGSIAGTVWNDEDGDGEFDPGESGMAGVTVYLDANNNSILDGGETFVVTASDNGGTPEDETGTYLFEDVTPGDYIVREVVPNGFDLTFPQAPPAPPSEYQIDVIFPDSSLTASQQAIFTLAAARWAEIITGDVPDVFGLPDFGDVDDLAIEATAPFIDGVGNILGSAGPSFIRTGSNIPVAGTMSFDSADIAALEASGELFDVIVHEMGHVIGIGTTWTANGLLTGAGGADPRFTGVQATAAYNTIFANSEASVPVANTGGAGTRDAHWREAIFDNELMTGFLDSGVANPISEVTIGSLADSGYTVNFAAADPYSPPGALVAARSSASPPVSGWFELLNDDFTYVDVAPEGVTPAVSFAAIAMEQDDFWEVEVLSGENVTGVDFGNQQLNQPPTIALQNTTTTLPEDTDTSSRVKVADIVVTDDGIGTNVLSLSGADAALFEIDGNELFLSAGVLLDNSANSFLDVVVDVDDSSIGSTPDDSASLNITVTDVPTTLTVDVLAASISEADGPAATTVQITRTGSRAQAMIVKLESSDTTEATIVGFATIEVGQSSVTVDLDAVDDLIVDGTQTVLITATEVVEATFAADTTFGTSGVATTTNRDNVSPKYLDMKVLPDGSVITIGRHPSLDDTWQVTKLTTDGQLDNSFGNSGVAVTTFTGESGVRPAGIALHDDGRITIIGRTGSKWLFARYLSNGTADTTFGTGGISVLTPFLTSRVYKGVALSDGSVVFVGQRFSDGGGMILGKIKNDGTLDAAFAGGGAFVPTLGSADERAFDIVQQTDGKFVVVGKSLYGSFSRFMAARFNSDGSLDTSFASIGYTDINVGFTNQEANSVALQSDGKIVVTGLGNNNGFDDNWAVVRLNTNGTLDTTFSGNGIDTVNFTGGNDHEARDVVIQPDGKILVVGGAFINGQGNNRALVRYNTDGTRDSSFGTNGIRVLANLPEVFEQTWAAALQGAEHVLLYSGFAENYRVERFSLFAPPPSAATGDDTVDVTDDDVNTAPTVSLQNTVTSLPEDTNTSSRIKVADIIVTDDGLGTNVLSLSGADAALFEIDGTELFLIAGATLDFETNPVLDVTVEVDDASVGATPDDTASLAITITDVNEFDFGDAPDSYDTFLSSDGARHFVVGPRLGSNVDTEADANLFLDGTGDDVTGSPDDEDGVTITPLTPGGTFRVTADVQNSAGNARLFGWIDFNGDGDFDDIGEQVVDGTVTLSTGLHTFDIDVPTAATAGDTFARFRLSTDTGLGFSGAASDGEVEDYPITIGPAPATVYVDDSWIGVNVGDDPDGAGDATAFGFDAFATIQQALDVVALNGAVVVHAGTYNEDLVIERNVWLRGATGTASDVQVISSAVDDAVFITNTVTNVLIESVAFSGAADDGIDTDGLTGTVRLTNVSVTGFNDGGIDLDNVSGGVILFDVVASNNGQVGIDLNNIGGSVLSVRTAAIGNAGPGMRVVGAGQFDDTDGNFSDNDDGGVLLTDITGDVILTRTRIEDNDADNDGTGDGLNAVDGADGDSLAIGGNVLLLGATIGTSNPGTTHQQTGAFIESIGALLGIADSPTGVIQSTVMSGNESDGLVVLVFRHS